MVGAPQYFEKEGKIGGAVYVYVNNGGKWNEIKPIRITGPQDSMFGLAVENLGDINQDGYHGEVQYWCDTTGCFIPFWSFSTFHERCI